MAAPFPNAFTINKLGFGGFFPLSGRIEKHESGVFQMDLCPVRICDLADLVVEAPCPFYLVYEVDQQSWTDPSTGRWLEFDEAVARLGIPARFHGRRTAVLAKSDFVHLAREVYHYNFHAMGLPAEPSRDEAMHLVETAQDHDFGEPMIARIRTARLFLSSHDDCYLYMEALDASLPKHAFSRTFWIYCSTVARARLRAKRTIPTLPDTLVDRLLPVGESLTVLRKDTQVRRHRLDVGYSRMKYEFGEEKEYELSGRLILDLDSGLWSQSEA